MKYLTVSAAALSVLGACTAAEWNSINRQFSPSMGDSRLIDAKQRAIIAIERPIIGGDGRPIQYAGSNGTVATAKTPVVCAEPSPDAIQATATALSASGEVSKANISALLNAALGTGEAASSFGLRTHTIQLLRDSYFRLCEAYLNDGIDSIAYNVLQRRFQNQIIALLAVEQLTGVVRGDQAGVTATGNAKSDGLVALRAQLKDQQTERDAALAAKQAADTAVSENAAAIKKLTDEKTQIEAEKKKLDPPPPPAVDSNKAARDELAVKLAAKENEIKAEQAKTEDLKKKAADADLRHKQAVELFNLFSKALVENAGGPGSASTGATTEVTQGGQNAPKLDSAVVFAVRAITLNALNQDYEDQVCFETLRHRNHSTIYKNDIAPANQGSSESAFSVYCQQLFIAKADIERARANAYTARGERIKEILNLTGKGQRLTAAEARDLILALDVVQPTIETQRFLPRNIQFTDDGVQPGNKTQSTPPGGGSVTTQQVPRSQLLQ